MSCFLSRAHFKTANWPNEIKPVSQVLKQLLES